MLTPASASHIRVTVKDDTLGLGARPKRDPLDEPTGLDAFKGLLGRLNGKSDAELDKEQRKRDDIKLARYAATKWQAVRFVRGGLLVQEKTDAVTTKTPESDNRESNHSQKPMNEKNDGTSNAVAIDGSNSSRSQNASMSNKDGNEKKEKKKKKKKEKENSRPKREDQDDKSQRKREKKAKKRKHSEENDNLDSTTKTGDTVVVEMNVATDEPRAPSSTTAPTSSSKERVPLGRNVTRARHIAQKKRALLDDKSLNEVIETPHMSCKNCSSIGLLAN